MVFKLVRTHIHCFKFYNCVSKKVPTREQGISWKEWIACTICCTVHSEASNILILTLHHPWRSDQAKSALHSEISLAFSSSILFSSRWILHAGKIPDTLHPICPSPLHSGTSAAVQQSHSFPDSSQPPCCRLSRPLRRGTAPVVWTPEQSGEYVSCYKLRPTFSNHMQAHVSHAIMTLPGDSHSLHLFLVCDK